VICRDQLDQLAWPGFMIDQVVHQGPAIEVDHLSVDVVDLPTSWVGPDLPHLQVRTIFLPDSFYLCSSLFSL